MPNPTDTPTIENVRRTPKRAGPDTPRAQITPRLARGHLWAPICREHDRWYSQESFSAPAKEIGRIWHADYDIDVAGKLLDGTVLYGECKWWKDRVGENVLDELIQRASLTDYGRNNHNRRFVLYARSGFTTALKRRAADRR